MKESSSIRALNDNMAKMVLVLGLFIMPVLGSVDYLQGHMYSAAGKAFSFMASVTGLMLHRLKLDFLDRGIFAATAILIMASIGAVTKLEDIASLVWVPVIPVLFVFVATSVQALIFSALYLFVYVLGYLSFEARMGIAPLEFGVWSLTVLAFLVVTGLLVYMSFVQETMQRKLHFAQFNDETTGLQKLVVFKENLSLYLDKGIVRSFFLVRFKLDDFVLIASKLDEVARRDLLHDVSMSIRDELPENSLLSVLGIDGFVMAAFDISEEDLKQLIRRIQVQLNSASVADYGPVSISSVAITGDLSSSALTNLARLQTEFYEISLIRKNHLYMR